MSFSLSATGVQVVLLDIEGTTTPADFVYKTLFPFARERLRAYLERVLPSDPEIKVAVDELHKQRDEEAATGQSVPDWLDEPVAARLQSVVTYAHWLMDQDRKSRPLRLQ